MPSAQDAPRVRDADATAPAAQASARVRLGEDRGRRALLVQGVVQSVAAHGPGALEGYWGHMLPDVRPTRALILGYGGGTLAHLLQARFGPLHIVGVDDDDEVLSLAESLCGPLPHLELVRADAFAYVDQARGPFDYAALDLFRGGEIPRGVFAKPFLRQLRGLLAPNAPLVVNLFRDGRTQSRLERLQHVFRLREQRPIGKNVVVICH
jgi:spermidine synthase